ncbi:DUF4351 domain-containing protein [Paramaledivibacter caminithermalis]|jgi:hypothetical protein|uniref:DUF4351 domain-containing protein n=1 Tax=Paramaledivibacter caminithermalis (strain DSM 15212 / CIP 107654 / DViRD3) TaxID=1121301 RepID=A0A1M6KEY6_PARC5|nr:DUF4351 domain-containing protein [Paramaledivibacter caminithermalis]SHJ57541.1 protein of unknown function [Paramaledivibacter caminithermalis DSM 15212]
MSYETRPQTYDETIKILEKKDYRGIAEFILPSVKDAEEVSLEPTQLSVPDMREMDFLAKVNMNSESFILHIEFETAYKSNTEMMKRMLRYYTYIKWHNDLPIYQVLVVLKKPENVKNIKGTFESKVQNLDVLKYKYKVIKAYEIDKNEVLKQRKIVLYPLRVFMKHDEIDEEQHIEECLKVVEGLEDKDYYYLTVECVKKLYKESKYEKYVKEEILMQSSLYREPYEKGIQQGRKDEKVNTVLKFLTKRFGILPDEIKEKIEKLDMINLDIILDKVLEYKDIDDLKKFLH